VRIRGEGAEELSRLREGGVGDDVEGRSPSSEAGGCGVIGDGDAEGRSRSREIGEAGGVGIG